MLSKQVDLPESFTNKIIDIIQNKQQESQNEEYVQENWEESGEEVRQSEEEEISPPRKKNNCKKSGKKIQNGVNNQSKPPTRIYKEIEESQRSEEDSSASIQEVTEELSKKESGQSSVERNSQQQQLSKQYQVFKEYFQDFITKLAKKMQNHTNSKLKELTERIEQLEDKAVSVQTPSRRHKKLQSQDEQFEARKEKKKRTRYIKTWLKLQYVEKIQRKLVTLREASKQLKIKESVIESWLANKDKLVALDNQRKGKKIYKDELDSDMLDID